MTDLTDTAAAAAAEERYAIKASYTTDPEPVRRVHRPHRREFYRQFVKTRTPAIITGLMDDWPAMSKWTPEYVLDALGRSTMPVNAQDPNDILLLGRIGQFVELSPGETLQRINSSSDGRVYYLRAYPFYQADQLWDDVKIPDVCPNWIDLRNSPFQASRKAISRTLEETLFVGGVGVTTPFHSDGVMTGAFLCQIYGRKHCVLISADQSKRMYHRPFRYTFGMSKVDFRRPELDKHPLYRDVRARECDLEPGEILYIPDSCWHGVISKEVSISHSVQILNRANLLRFLRGMAERPFASAYYKSKGGIRQVTGAVTWE
ncbi:MAG TPA: cupin-like domain-containing protein [Streptosporangiaceae bacterium]|nr:cupin-like domain-containing protein [Streptosporangiaceae bacterium]